MNTENNKLRQDTDRRMREALLELMREGKMQISVADICERSPVNRSTFYRHYIDIFDLMENTERGLQTGLVERIQKSGAGFSFPPEDGAFLVPLIEYVGQYDFFYRVYLENHSAGTMEKGFKEVWESLIKPAFLALGVTDEREMLYYYAYAKAGMTTVLKMWLDGGKAEAPEEIAKIIFNMMKREN